MNLQMTPLKKLCTAVLTAGVLLSLAACGAPSAPSEIMLTAAEQLSDVKSMTCTLNMDSEMGITGRAFCMTTEGTADCILEPAAMDADLTFGIDDLKMPGKLYLQSEKDGSYTLYNGMEDESEAGTMLWSKMPLENMEGLRENDTFAAMVMNSCSIMKMYVSGGRRFEEKGTDVIDGKDTVRYDGTISGDALMDVMTFSGALDPFSMLGMDDQAVKDVLKKLKTLPISIWLEKDSGFPVQCETDISPLALKLTKNIMADEITDKQPAVGRMTLRMTLTNINGVDDITVPEEVVNSAM